MPSERIALISDCHGNSEALDAVLNDIKRRGIKYIRCLGDTVGYGPDPNGTLDRVRDNCFEVLLGNHDLAALDLQEAADFSGAAYGSAVWTREQLIQHGTRDPLGYLGTLQPAAQDGDVSYYHGSPRYPVTEYVTARDVGNTRKMKEIFDLIDRIAFIGHTHEAGLFLYDGSRVTHVPQVMVPDDYESPADKTLVNVGSVGQPRDSNPDACYVIFDGTKITYVRVPYDVQKVAEAIWQIPELDHFLGERILTGR